MQEQAGLRRYVLRELERRGPLLSRQLEHEAARADAHHVWWGTRAQLSWMLELLHGRGRGRCDPPGRWCPDAATGPRREARRLLAEKRRRALGVWLEKGEWHAHP